MPAQNMFPLLALHIRKQLTVIYALDPVCCVGFS